MSFLEHAYCHRELVFLHPGIRDAVGNVFLVVRRLPNNDPFDGPEYLLQSILDGCHVIVDEALIEGRALAV